MNLTPLYELKERMEASVIAGTALISEDFRLRRAAERLAPLAKASPVFDKIYQSSQKLLSENQENKGTALLEILALVNAVLTTQAAVGAEGTLTPCPIFHAEEALNTDRAYEADEAAKAAQTPIPDTDFSEKKSPDKNICSNPKYSELAPILEALTTSGSGHYSLLLETHEKNPGLFSDFRLKPALIAGLNAGYAELADRIEEWLIQGGDRTLIPLLKQGFDPRGKKEMLRRTRVIEAIAKGSENEWYLSMLNEAQKDIRAALLCALHYTPANQDILLEFIKTEKGLCKKAALWSYAQMDLSQTREFWEMQLQKNTGSAPYLTLSADDTASDLISHALHAILDQLKAQADNSDFRLTDKNYKNFRNLCSALPGKAAPDMLGFYRRIAEDKEIDQFHTKDCHTLFDPNDVNTDPELIMPTAYHAADLLADSLLYTMDERLIDLADELYRTYGELFLKPALTAALLTKDATCAYEAFAVPLLEKKLEQGNETENPAACLAMMELFSKLSWNPIREAYTFTWQHYEEAINKHIKVCRPLYEKPDPRWFRLFTHPNLKKSRAFHIYQHSAYHYFRYWDYTLGNLICPSDREICSILGSYFYQCALTTIQIPQAVFSNEQDYYRLMNKCGFTGGKGLVIRDLKKGKIEFWNVKYMLQTAPMPQADKLKELEKIRELADKNEIRIIGWNENSYQELRKSLEL